ncbi:hypothetical protein TTHERM_00678460 (macronuclear) [Tetrahymena thermophila SB210]|uniref:Uncharacterized protein n=1 Tax=Tetrahymena thermophila (strain SB210) TaxID=312017 RepID=I7LY34_TETTS|nr:hypothetical protein TTHERM_00678460 [Tetrahymena thermophila SB210]EAS07580.2 hypothetical protein TTHERM_00678460 [Tetrahymena thermophila SB210]|eukprot:XP_001027822.2 hypothetical protein TTHERM_00678460 [Tetrahymena thermophila SB210]
MSVLDECLQIINQFTEKHTGKVKDIDQSDKCQLINDLKLYLSKINGKKDMNLIENSLSCLQKLQICPNQLVFSIVYELYMYYLRVEESSKSLKQVMNHKLLLILKSKYLEEHHLCNIVNHLDKTTSVLQILSQQDKLSVYIFFLEKIFQGHSNNLNEVIRICSRLAAEDKKDYLEGLGLMIATEYQDNKQQKIKLNNGERIDCISMLIFGLMNKIYNIQTEQQIENENEILEIYNLAIKCIDDFLKNLFRKVIEEGNQASSISVAASTKNKKESHKIQLFLFNFINDICKQLYSQEYSIIPVIFNVFTSILNSYINLSNYQNNHFIIDLTKSILKILYKDTQQITQFSQDMQIIFCQKALKGKKSKYNGSVFCNVCSEIGFFTLKQNEHEISFCQECSNLEITSQHISQIKNLSDLLIKEQIAFLQTLTYLYADTHHKTLNINFLESRSTNIILHFVQQAYNKPINAKNKKITFFLNTLTSQTKLGNPPDSLGSTELDFLDFIYKSKIQTMFAIQDKIEYLLKYIFGLTNDNSSIIRNKSLTILNEIEGFNRSQRFEQYIDIRRRDQQVTVRMTCLKILEQLYMSEDQTQFESDIEYRERKERYFKMIMDRFNDKETQVRGTVLSFISSNLNTIANDNQQKISLIKELVIRVLSDTQEFQIQSLDVLAKIYFPFFQGKQETKKAVKKTKKETKKNQNILNIEEEKTLENIIELQKLYEINTDIMVRIFSHFQENQSDSASILNTMLQISLKILEEFISDKKERRFILEIIEVLSRMKNIFDIYQEFQIFISYFDLLVLERNQIPIANKEQRAETNLCMIIILDIIINMFQRNSIVSNPQIKSSISKIEDKLLNLIQKEGNVQVLKKLVQLSAYSINYSSQDIQKILDIFKQRYAFLKNVSDMQNLSQKINFGDQNESEILIFKITMSMYIVSIYSYHFMKGSFQALSINLKDVLALLLFYLSLPNERIQAASFENISMLWEKEYDLIFSCQDILQEIIVSKSTSAKLLITIYTIFDKYILKHSNQIKKKINTQITVKNSMVEESEENNQRKSIDQELEHITSIIRDLTIKSYEQGLQNPDQMVKKTILRLLNLLVNENLVIFQQVGANIICLVCDPDILIRTLANSIIQEECLRNKYSIDKCLKAGLRKSAVFIDQNYKQFTITEGPEDKCQSLFERINTVLKLKDTPEKDTNIFAKRVCEILNEINEWSYEDHEVAFFIMQLIISLNQITHGDILIFLNGMKSVSDKVYYEVKDFLKRAINNQIDQFDEEDDLENEKAFIKTNILLMCLVTSHILIIQSSLSLGKYQQIDSFIQKLSSSYLEETTILDNQSNNRNSDLQQQLKVKWVKKFNGNRNLLDNFSDLFLEQMRDFDCSNEAQLKMLRKKIKHLFYDYVESDIIKVLDLTYTDTDKNLNSDMKSKETTKLNQRGKPTKAYDISKASTKHRNIQKQNSHKSSNNSESSYHSCKGSKSSNYQDLDYSGVSHKSASSQISNPFKMNLRNRQNVKRYSKIQEDQSDTQSDEDSQQNYKNNKENDDFDDDYA